MSKTGITDRDGVAGGDGDKSVPPQRRGVNVECVFFGPLREPVGTKTVTVELDEGATVRELLAELAEAYEELAFFEDGELRGDRTVTVEKKDVRHRDGLETGLSEGDTVRLTTAVYGGAR